MISDLYLADQVVRSVTSSYFIVDRGVVEGMIAGAVRE